MLSRRERDDLFIRDEFLHPVEDVHLRFFQDILIRDHRLENVEHTVEVCQIVMERSVLDHTYRARTTCCFWRVHCASSAFVNPS